MRLLIIVFLIAPELNLSGPRFLPLTNTFKPNSAFVFLYEFPAPRTHNLWLLLSVIKTILYAVWKFHNRATFHNGKANSSDISRYVLQQGNLS